MVRRFFCFSVRDLLWLVLVVAMGLGWARHESQHRAELEQANSLAAQWRGAAGALEHDLREDGCSVEWDHDLASVCIYHSDYAHVLRRVIPTSAFQPSDPK